MKRNALFAVTCLACAALFAGCGASPVHYHTLASSQPFEHAARTRADFAIDVMPVRMPPSLDQAYLAIRTGQTEVEFVDDERWASPLGNEIRAALSRRLASRLDTDDVGDVDGLGDTSSPSDINADSGFSSNSNYNKPVATIEVEIRQLDVWPGSRVQLTAGWKARLSDRKAGGLSCVTQLQAPVAARDYGSVVQAQQAAILELADIIGADVISLEKSAPAQRSCSSAEHAPAIASTD
ncbi:PqiC family protein [Trinickia dinghuensis]|uniref:ABC-type transport auxiliary lipoprotein component domain-containing protein n=1 Tax=Trinickia dinghuensis TaxID=2291023 RepID=A0A3D8K614_9BURK|nr:PqiC family protein [Trinickia dinghuensis]RDV00305.1 hypothetical protein DWV00_00390 [Trinickia dinghuensis]